MFVEGQSAIYYYYLCMASKFQSPNGQQWPEMWFLLMSCLLVHERWTYVLLWFVSHENSYSTKELQSKHLPKLSTSIGHSRWISLLYSHRVFSDRNRFLKDFVQKQQKKHFVTLFVMHSELIAFWHLWLLCVRSKKFTNMFRLSWQNIFYMNANILKPSIPSWNVNSVCV